MKVFVVMIVNEGLENINGVFSTLEKAERQVEYIESTFNGMSAYIVESMVL